MFNKSSELTITLNRSFALRVYFLETSFLFPHIGDPARRRLQRRIRRLVCAEERPHAQLNPLHRNDPRIGHNSHHKLAGSRRSEDERTGCCKSERIASSDPWAHADDGVLGLEQRQPVNKERRTVGECSRASKRKTVVDVAGRCIERRCTRNRRPTGKEIEANKITVESINWMIFNRSVKID